LAKPLKMVLDDAANPRGKARAVRRDILFKCELHYVVRNLAIGMPLLPLRQPGHGKVKHSGGYLVQVAKRQCVEYVEPHRKAMIEVRAKRTFSTDAISVELSLEVPNGLLIRQKLDIKADARP
jgi:hypothetical protein